MTSYLHNIVRRGALPLVGPKAANSPIEPSRRFEQTIEPEAHLFKTAHLASLAPDEAEHMSETVDSPIKPDRTGDPDIHPHEASHYSPRPTEGIAPPEPTDTAQHQTS